MRVRLSYSVETEEIIEEVKRLLNTAENKLCNQIGTLKRSHDDLTEEDLLRVIKQIDLTRQELSRYDQTLEDCFAILQGYSRYIREQQEQKKRWDQAFVQVLPYIQLDWRGFSQKEIFNQEVAFQGWNEKKYMVTYRLAEKMKIGAQAEMEVDVDGELVRLPLEFPGGIKSLFIISDLAGELL